MSHDFGELLHPYEFTFFIYQVVALIGFYFAFILDCEYNNGTQILIQTKPQLQIS